MTDRELKSAVISVNNAFAENNPKGLTAALRGIGYPVDNRFDILSYDELNNALINLYNSNQQKWGEVVGAVKFNYEKTDSSTSQNTKAAFENIIKSLDSNYVSPSSTGKFTLPKWAETAIGLLVGQTTTVHTGTPPPPAPTPVWAYVGLTVIGLAIVAIVFFALRTKNI